MKNSKLFALIYLLPAAAVSLLAQSSEVDTAEPASERASSTRTQSSSNEPRQASSSRDDAAGVQSILDSLSLGSDAMDWRGKQFNLGDLEMAQARFEKYLNSPPSTSEDDLTYDTLLTEISHRLIGKGGGSDEQRVSEAWRMLYRAAEFPMDAGLSEILGDRIVSFWQTNRKIAALELQTERLERDRQYREGKIVSIADKDRKEFIQMTRGTTNRDAPPPPARDHQSGPQEKRLERIEAKIDENESFEATSRITQKLEYQSLIVQFFVQRRFQHALIANDFYRYMFNAEDNELEGADALKGQVFGDLDVKITTSTLDALSKEAISDVESSLDTVNYLLEQGEIHNATKRLMEAFYLGEYLPPIKRFPLEKKRKIAAYVRDLTSLASSLEVKSFDRAEKKLEEIESYAEDFDGGKADAFIQTSKQLSNLAIQRALSAAYEQDRSGIEAGLEEAVRYWPTNPGITEFSGKLLEKTDIKDMAALDFDRYIRQDDYRAIFNDRFRFAAALALDKERNTKFLGIMKRMEAIESAMAQAKELSRIQNTFGAWEVLERVYREYPEDQDLNRLRGDYAVNASQFASVIAVAEQAREKENYGKALFAYLEAQKLYPASFFVEEGIQESVDTILLDRSDLPEDSETSELADEPEELKPDDIFNLEAG